MFRCLLQILNQRKLSKVTIVIHPTLISGAFAYPHDNRRVVGNIVRNPNTNDPYSIDRIDVFYYNFLSTKRTANLGVKIGFHRGTWSAENMEKYYNSKKEKYGWQTPFDFSSWVYDLVQIEVHELTTYLRSRGVSSYISDQTYRLGENEMWFPRRDELLISGILTE